MIFRGVIYDGVTDVNDMWVSDQEAIYTALNGKFDVDADLKNNPSKYIDVSFDPSQIDGAELYFEGEDISPHLRIVVAEIRKVDNLLLPVVSIAFKIDIPTCMPWSKSSEILEDIQNSGIQITTGVSPFWRTRSPDDLIPINPRLVTFVD